MVGYGLTLGVALGCADVVGVGLTVGKALGAGLEVGWGLTVGPQVCPGGGGGGGGGRWTDPWVPPLVPSPPGPGS